jgi:hypothetical protein
MKILTRTCFGALLQTCQLLGVPFVLTPETTLNEKFGVMAGVAPPAGQIQNMTGADGFPYNTPLQHLPTDAALFKALPFIVRTPNNDLDPVTRAQYGMRTAITGYGGVQLIAYYLKRISLTGIVPNMEISSVSQGVTTTIPYVPTSANLNPTPPVTSSAGVVTTSGSYITTSAIMPIPFTAQDVAELINSAMLIYNNGQYAIVSEIGLVSGVDQIYTPAGGTLSYKEVVAAQIAMHITSYYAIGSSNQGFQFQIQVGATEPLYGATSIQTSLYTPSA